MPIRTRSPSPTIAASFLALALPACAVAAAPAPTPAGPLVRTALTPQARGEAIRDFVLKWAPHVRATHGVDLHAWAMRLGPQFAKGDPANLREARSRTTFEGAMAALDGVGRRLSDDRVSSVLAALPPGPLDARRTAIAKAPGDTTRDLVYTPRSRRAASSTPATRRSAPSTPTAAAASWPQASPTACSRMAPTATAAWRWKRRPHWP